MSEHEVLDTLADELEANVAEFAQHLRVLAQPAEPAAVTAASLGYLEHLRRLLMATQMLELPALERVVQFFRHNWEHFAAMECSRRGKHHDTLAGWPDALIQCLRAADDEAIETFVEFLSTQKWPVALTEEPAALASALGSELKPQSTTSSELEPEPKDASPRADPLALSFAPEIGPPLIEAFLEEAPQHAAKLSEHIRHLATKQANHDDLMQAQRAAHTLKGSASITGVRGIANVTHYTEDLLERYAKRRTLPPPELCHTLNEAADCLETMVEHLGGLGTAPENAPALLEQLEAWSKSPPHEEEHGAGEGLGRPADASALANGSEHDDRIIEFSDLAKRSPSPSPSPAASLTSESSRAFESKTLGESWESEGLDQDHSAQPMLRVATSTIDDLLRLAGEIATAIVRLQGMHQRTDEYVNTIGNHNLLAQQRLAGLQELVEVRGVPAEKRLAVVGGPDFDPLELDEYSELHSATNAFSETLTDLRELGSALRGELDELAESLLQQERISTELNDAVLAARMVPVQTIVPRLERIVRQTCREAGRDATLSVQGAELLIDTETLNSVMAPLMHLVRNAIDHGIEAPKVRKAKGKPDSGHIALVFAREGEQVSISCSDDGAGFDFDGIRRLAAQRGLLRPDQTLTQSELARFTLLPGFSTRPDATQISGRGIGMDVVHENVQELRGALSIDSQPSHGTRITMRLPLTLISMHVLLLRIGERFFGVPSSSVAQVLFSDSGEIVGAGSDWSFRFQGEDYEMRTLGELVGISSPSLPAMRHQPLSVVLISDMELRASIVVDEVVGGRHRVVQRLGENVPRVRGVVGASILADGGVAPVLDLRELLRRPAVSDVDLPAAHVVPARVPGNVLVVDDSLSARHLLAQVVGDTGFEARAAVDGLDAIAAVEERLPDLVIVDMEMPRMNGLELASHLKSNPATRQIPLMMVTSRSTLKHREQARAAGIEIFVTKPYEVEYVAEQIRRLASRP